MVFFRKPLVCYLTSTYLEVFETNTHNQYRLSFSPESIKHAEIVNENKFKEELQKFLEGLNLKKGKGIIVLSKELVYVSDIITSSKSEKDEISKFIAILPLVKLDISTIPLHSKKRIQIIATNRKLFECVDEILRMNDIEIFSISPVSVFDFMINDQELSPQDASKIAGAKKKLEEFNFQKGKDNSDDEEINKKMYIEEDSAEVEVEPKNIRKQYILFALSIILLASSVGYFLYWKGIIKVPFLTSSEIKPGKPANIIAPSATSSISPTVEPLIDKTSIKIQILNGSGVEGQAGKIGEILKRIGFSNVTTANTDNLGQKTTITYSKLIPKNLLTDITDAIKNDFPSPVLQEATKSTEFDIIITTGKF